MNLWIKAMLESYCFSIEYHNLVSMGEKFFKFYVSAENCIYSNYGILGFELSMNSKQELVFCTAYVDSEFLNLNDINRKIFDLNIDKLIVETDKNHILNDLVININYLIPIEFKVSVNNVLIRIKEIIDVDSNSFTSFYDLLIERKSNEKYSFLIDLSNKEEDWCKISNLIKNDVFSYLTVLINYPCYDDKFLDYLKNFIHRLESIDFDSIEHKGLFLARKLLLYNLKYSDSDELNLDLFDFLSHLKSEGYAIYVEEK